LKKHTVYLLTLSTLLSSSAFATTTIECSASRFENDGAKELTQTATLNFSDAEKAILMDLSLTQKEVIASSAENQDLGDAISAKRINFTARETTHSYADQNLKFDLLAIDSRQSTVDIEFKGDLELLNDIRFAEKNGSGALKEYISLKLQAAHFEGKSSVTIRFNVKSRAFKLKHDPLGAPKENVMELSRDLELFGKDSAGKTILIGSATHIVYQFDGVNCEL
jgi:hypothetical protein